MMANTAKRTVLCRSAAPGRVVTEPCGTWEVHAVMEDQRAPFEPEQRLAVPWARRIVKQGAVIHRPATPACLRSVLTRPGGPPLRDSSFTARGR